jgi:hypothetical protein
MKIQNIEFFRLKAFLSSIEITDSFTCFGPKEEYTEVLITKQHSETSTWSLTFNKKSHKEYFNSLDNLQDTFFKEISTNNLLNIDKQLIHNYFKDVYEFFIAISNGINYDSLTKKWVCGFIYFNENFLLNKLDAYFQNGIENFIEKLNEKIVAIMVHLNEIEGYRECVINIETSPQGNLKIIWTKYSNQLVYFFLEMIEKEIIDTTPENLKRFLINNFLDRDGIELNEYTIETYFKPSAGKYPKRGNVNPGDFLNTAQDTVK